MRKRPPPEGQASLFAAPRPAAAPPVRTGRRLAAGEAGARRWRMPEVSGRTVAEIRLRWSKRLTPAQVARIETELGALPRTLTKLGFGPVEVERVFVRRRRG
jgi:hypothetical protein